MKRKILTITYTCPDDTVNLKESDIMGYALQKLGELGAYDINMQASSANLVEPMMPKAPELDIKLPEFMQQKQRRANLSGILRHVEGGAVYGKTV